MICPYSSSYVCPHVEDDDSFNCVYIDVCDQDCLSCPYFKAFLEVFK